MTSAPSASSCAAQLARLLAGPGDDDRRPKSGRCSNHVRSSAATVADDDRARRLHVGVADGRRAWRGRSAGRAGCRCALRRRAWPREAAGHRAGRRSRRCAPAPMRITRVPPGAGERVPVDVGAALRRVLVTGDDREVGGEAAVRHRDARVRGRGDRTRDAGHHFERRRRPRQRLGLLAAATEHEGIAALQPHDGRAVPPALDEDGVDLVLGERDRAGRLGRRDQLGAGAAQIQERGRGEAVVDHDVGNAKRRRRAR